MLNHATDILCPSKTFLLGEYLALQAGPCFVITTQPQFRLCVQPGEFALKNIHPDSPAGRFIQDKLSQHAVHFEFFDPYNGLGGFGASTAQFLAAYAFWRAESDWDMSHLLETYLHYAYSGQGLAPSGADLIAQWQGGVTFFDKKTMQAEPLAWPFKNLQFALLHTQQKLATHTHLQAIDTINTDDLLAPVLEAKQAWQSAEAAHLINAVNDYQARLQSKGLTATHSLKHIAHCQSIPGVLAVKGCGAMGSDVILLLHQLDDLLPVRNYCRDHGLKWIASDADLAEGTQMNYTPTLKED